MPKIITEPQLDFSNVLIRPKRSTLSSRSEINLKRTMVMPHSCNDWTGVPIIAANMDTTGTFEVYETLAKHGCVTALHKFYTKDDFLEYQAKTGESGLNPDLFMVSTGITNDDYDRLVEIMSVIDCNWICVDVANGYIPRLVDFCKSLRELYPNKNIVAGNVATREMVEELIINGRVDVVKIGIGPGSACTTRLKTGVGVPQLSAILECADAAHGCDGRIIADGGITCPGDMAKAFGAGADFVMIGGQFAGHDQNPGKVIEENGRKMKLFYGMSSKQAMVKHYGKMDNYRSSEGRELKIPYKGDLNDTIEDYLGGLRSTCTYIGAREIRDMSKCTTFLLTSQQLNKHFV